MSRRALITGAAGFTGRYMAVELQKAGYDVWGLVKKQPAEAVPGVEVVEACDLSDGPGLASAIERARPDVIVHLAAISHVSHDDIDDIYLTNLLGTRHLLEAVVRAGVAPKAILLASSATVYGNAIGGKLDETTTPAPASDYAISKLAMEQLARLYHGRLPIFVVRPFNYTGVGQNKNFLLPKIIGYAARRDPVIELGNLDVARDFSDVRTVVAYYRRLLEAPEAVGGTFNICAGEAHTLTDVLDMVRELSGHDLQVRVNPEFVRPNDIKILLGSREKLDRAVGVVEPIPLRETVRWMLEEESRCA